MSRTPLNLDDALTAYVRDHSESPDDVERELIAETARLPNAGMQVAPEQARFLSLLVKLSGAHRVLEVGTFTGYSALAMARALPAGGRLVACDVSEEWTSIARRYWTRAGVADRIDLRIGPALDTLHTLAGSTFDLAFIDADKGNYVAYYDRVVPMLRQGGMFLADNTLWSGRVIDPDEQGGDVDAIREFNDRVAADTRVEKLLLPTFDGLTMALKR